MNESRNYLACDASSSDWTIFHSNAARNANEQVANLSELGHTWHDCLWAAMWLEHLRQFRQILLRTKCDWPDVIFYRLKKLHARSAYAN